MRILVVEDEAALRETLKTRLVEAGFTVDVASDGNEGMFAGQEYPLDVAIIDLGLPGLSGLEVIRKLKDPIGAIMASWRRPNGMRIERVRVPLGVVGVIYESRPNVTADAGALCLKAGNAVILRGGSDSFRSSRAIHTALVEGLAEAGLPTAAITLVPTRDREAVGMMLAGLDGVTVQVAFVSVRPLRSAVNCCVAPAGTVGVVGETVRPDPAPTVTIAVFDVTVPVVD